ncbi:unnamed protein product [Lactuca saligna]|uniref:Uncharacterized protein n=1 Tax=Lactuca saligna TaxID=75948 RepID=A0AA35YJK4_LACSI|nr:unnamed protein product [Lactuca saligna]
MTHHTRVASSGGRLDRRRTWEEAVTLLCGCRTGVRSEGKGGLGPWAGHEDEAAFGRREGGHLARWSKASGNRSSDGGFWQWCSIEEEERISRGSRRDRYTLEQDQSLLVFLTEKKEFWMFRFIVWVLATSELIKANLELTLKQYRPMVLSYLSFSKFTLSTVAPRFIGVSTVEDGGEGITMDMEMNWDGNPRLEGLDAGLASVLESMEFCLELRGSKACALEDFAKAINLVHLRKDLVESGHVLLNHAYHNQQEYERYEGGTGIRDSDGIGICDSNPMPNKWSLILSEGRTRLSDSDRIGISDSDGTKTLQKLQMKTKIAREPFDIMVNVMECIFVYV